MNSYLMFMLGVILFLIVSCGTTSIASDEHPIPANVLVVKQGGYWQFDEKCGFVRASIRNGGYEKVMSSLELEWIAEPEGPGASHKVIKRVEVNELDGMWSMGEISFVKEGKNTTVHVEATNVHVFDRIERKILKVKLTGIGVYELQ